MEHYVTSETLMRFYLDKTDADDQTKRSFAIRYENDLEGFKKNGIEAVFNITPEIFHDSIGFDDWPSAMAYLQQNRQEAFNFWRKGE